MARGKKNKSDYSKRLKRHNIRRVLSTFTIISLLGAIFVLLIIISPKEPLYRARGSVSGDDTQEFIGPSSEYDGLLISEIMASNSSAVPDSNGNYSDYIEIWNSSNSPINLHNVGLSDRMDKVLFLFPNIDIGVDERLIVYASGVNHIVDKHSLHAKFKISSTNQETITLFDPYQFVLDFIQLPVLNSNQVYSLNDEGIFVKSDLYSPGFPNDEQGHIDYRSSIAVSKGSLLINEIMANPLTGVTDLDGELPDWVEIYNPTNKAQSLKNIYLSDNPSKPFKWQFPDDAVISANGYYVVFCTGKDIIENVTVVPHSNFRIKTEGETLVISDGLGAVIDMVSFDNMPIDQSYGRDFNGEYHFFEIATPGLPNTKEGAQKMEEYLRLVNPSGVYVLEVLASNTLIKLHEGDDAYCDYIELYNSKDQPFDISGYGLSDNINRPRKWQFPPGSIIQPGEIKLIYMDKKDKLDDNGYHTNFKISQHGGEVLTFSDPSGRILDKIHLPPIPSNFSYGRIASQSGFFYFRDPTPRLENSSGIFNGFAKIPAFSLRGGLYDNMIELDIHVPEDSYVFYTLNGDTPTTESFFYEGTPIPITHTTVVRAKSFSADPYIEPSKPITQSYIIGTAHTLPIVSLVGENYDIFDPLEGLLAVGVEIPTENVKQPFGKVYGALYATKGKIWRTGYVEVYSQDNEQQVNQPISFALQGQYSLDHAQKSFKLKSRAPLGKRYIDTELFEDRDFEIYKGFVLRSGGNDTIWTRLLDGFNSRLLDLVDTPVLRQAWNPVAVYLNGEYWGHYNMRERIDRYFVAQHEGLPMEEADNMVILEGSGNKVKYGSNAEYRALIKKVKTLSPGKKPEDLQYILDRIDVDNYFDYMAIVMFVGDSDPGNIRFYKLDGENQKWKWILYDKDYGLFDSTFNSPRSYLKKSGMGAQNIDNTLLVKLLEDSTMKDKFLTRLGEIYQILTTEAMLGVLEPMIELLEPEMPVHFARWAEYVVKQIAMENPTTPEGALRYWYQRLDRLKNTLNKRPTLFYDMVKNEFKLSDSDMLKYFGEKPEMPEGTK